MAAVLDCRVLENATSARRLLSGLLYVTLRAPSGARRNAHVSRLPAPQPHAPVACADSVSTGREPLPTASGTPAAAHPLSVSELPLPDKRPRPALEPPDEQPRSAPTVDRPSNFGTEPPPTESPTAAHPELSPPVKRLRFAPKLPSEVEPLPPKAHRRSDPDADLLSPPPPPIPMHRPHPARQVLPGPLPAHSRPLVEWGSSLRAPRPLRHSKQHHQGTSMCDCKDIHVCDQLTPA